MVLEGTSSNKRNFAVVPEHVHLPAFGTATASVIYTASTLDGVEEADVVYTHPSTGPWVYKLRGTGLMPSEMPVTTVIEAVGGSSQATVFFTNPFAFDIDVAVEFEAESADLTMLLPQAARVSRRVAAFGALQIPFAFAPRSMATSRAVVTVKYENKVQWHFPLVGVAELGDVHLKVGASG